jgi:light-regulated signal transduction histidine kinase (bacteriophytochrome)
MHSGKLKILLVEDNPADALFLRRCLSEAFETPPELIHCLTAEAGQRAMAAGDIDCVFLDYVLGNVNGLDVLGDIRGSGDDVPVITITGRGDETVAVESMKRGAQDYLVKDRITPQSLHRAVTNAMQKVALERKLAEKREELERFVSVASHDLKAPLRRICRFAELLKKRRRGGISEEADRDIDFIVTSANHMRRLVDALLEYARVGRSGKALRPVDLNTVMETVLEDLQAVIEESNARVDVEPLPTVLGDEIALVQLLQNLVANAVKFRGEQTPVIEVSACRQGDGWRISVRDNGIGIARAYQQRIFAAFHRLHKPGEYEGSGIGLATCKKIIDQHRGRIWVESEPGKGSTFHFTLEDRSPADTGPALTASTPTCRSA